MNDGGFRHIITRGEKISWSNNRIGSAHTLKVLDRVIINKDCISFWSSISCASLTKGCSDHFPWLLNMHKGIKLHPSPFKYFSMWADHNDCERLVKESWSQLVIGCHMFVLMQKLKRIKVAFKEWNRSVFGDIHLKVDNVKSAIEEIQLQIDSDGYCDELHAKEVKAQIELNEALS